MSNRYLLVLESKNSAIVVECQGLDSLGKFMENAEQKGISCKQISIEEFYPAYRGFRYFDLRNPITRQTFRIEDFIEVLEAPLEDHGDEENLSGGPILH